jgi:NitT/TauT family transport system permease protein
MKRRYIYIIAICALVVGWELSGRNSNITKLFISTPLESLNYFAENISHLLLATWTTFIESFLGLLISTFFSFFVMVIGLYSKKFLDTIMPVMIVSQIIPIITLAPLIILIFGIGIKAKVIVSALMCFFPIFINFNNGVGSIREEVLDLLKVYNATTLFKIRRVYFPLSMPNIMTGLKVSSLLSVIGAIVGEFNGADVGLGKNLYLAAKRLEPELMINSLFLSAIIGFLLYGSVMLIENVFGKWYVKSVKI